MTIKTTAAAIGAAILIAGSTALASAAGSNPIALRNVEIAPAYTFSNDFDPGYVTVAYSNERDVPATEVVFDLQADGQAVQSYRDRGNFATGTTIKHTFVDDSASPDQQVSVASVTFADGSTWTNTELPPAMRQASNVSDDFSFAALW